jgi:hypothetical protein
LGHIAPFPEEIPYRLIRLFTFKGDVVLDPFLGSGTTLQVCRITHRRGIGFEIVKEYADLIKRRISEDWTPPGLETDEKWNTAKKAPSSTLEQFLKTEKI